MTKIKKRHIRYDRILIVLIIIVGSFFLIRSLSKKELKDTTSYMPNLIGLNINDGIDEIKKYNFEIEKEYIYDETDKDTIIEQSIKENTKIDNQKELIIKISKGKIDKEKLKQDNINELGKIPIMMYHGIVDKKNSETDYIGGNVDKDGYTRTSEAFRQDLELYYEKGYRMIRISDYIEGKIDVPYGYSPIILTFDDGNANNLKVTGLDEKGNIIIDKNSAVGILEEFKKKYPDYNVTAIFFVTNNLFNQPEYNEKILSWLVDNGYEVGNHTKGHDNFKNIDINKTQEVVGYMYNKLSTIINDKYSKIVALPFGSPYSKEHSNYKYIIDGSYDGVEYHTKAALRVGWEPEVSPFHKDFDETFLKRCRAYDNNGKDFDIEMVLRMNEKSRYISDGDITTITTSKENEELIKNETLEKIIY